MSKIYNEEIKERFLNIYDNEGTKTTMRHVFMKSYPEEYRLNKDLATFTLDDIREVVKEANPHNLQTAKSFVRFCKQYISWGVEEGLRKSNILSFDAITDEWYEGLIDKSKKIHYSYRQFVDLLEGIINGQDQCFLALIFSGLMGKSFHELREIKVSDINFDTNQVYVKERDTYVTIANPELMKYVEKAINQNTYFTFNPETQEHNERQLADSEFLFRNIMSPRTQGGMVNPSVFYTRINNIRTEFSLDYLTPMAIKQSGIIYHCYLMYKEFGKLGYEEFDSLQQNYQMPNVNSPSGTYINTSLIKEYVSESNLKTLYNIDIKF